MKVWVCAHAWISPDKHTIATARTVIASDLNSRQ